MGFRNISRRKANGTHVPGAIRVLVAEENHSLCEAYREVFRTAGFCVDFAWDGLSARALLQIIDYDAVVANFDLPGICGPSLFFGILWPSEPPKLFLTNPSLKWRIYREHTGIPLSDIVHHPDELYQLAERIKGSIAAEGSVQSATAARNPLPQMAVSP